MKRSTILAEIANAMLLIMMVMVQGHGGVSWTHNDGERGPSWDSWPRTVYIPLA